MKALLVIGAVLAASGMHVTLRLAGYPVAVPVPVLILAAELVILGVLCLLIRRAVRAFPLPPLLPWRTA